jgi:hypothetical protein
MRAPRSGFLLGLLLGTLLGSASVLVAEAMEPRVVGDSGYLIGWEIVDSDGDTVCDDPFVWKELRQMECD